MGLKGNNFHHANLLGIALPAQSVNNTTVNGSAIKEPWRTGRQITFIWVGGAFAASSTGRLRIQGLKRSDGTTWETLKEFNGSTDLEFTPTDFDDTKAAENGVLIGTIDLGFVDGEKYKHLRVTLQAEDANAILGGVAYCISDLYQKPSGQADNLFAKTRKP
jgi:hypothetical protein